MPRLLAIALLTCAGCFTTGVRDEPAPPPVQPAPPPVMPDQVTPQNAQAIARLLQEEMDRDDRRLLPNMASR